MRQRSRGWDWTKGKRVQIVELLEEAGAAQALFGELSGDACDFPAPPP